jgi:glycosyltransferase involved in cell wall biosynthesis
VDSSGDKRKLKLLLVAYDFPPVASAGMYRIVGMAKYLQRMGWDITVLTVRKTFVYTSEESLKLIPPGVRVVRTASFDFRRLARAVEERAGAPRDAEGMDCKSNEGRVKQFLGRIVNLMLRVIDRLFRFPDIKAGWSMPLFVNAWKLLRNEQFDAVLSSSPPHSLQLPLLVLRIFARFHWVTDFRDPWTAPRRAKRTTLGDCVKRLLEKRVVSGSDVVVANTPGNRDALAAEFGEAVARRTVVITNGLDLDLDGKGIEDDEALDCDLVYMGELYDGMLDVYVEALRWLLDHGEGAAPRLWVYGGPPSVSTHRKVRDLGLEEWIVFKGRVPYEASRRIIRKSRALLLLLPHRVGHGTWVPSKLYSYLFSSAPILALVPEGDAGAIVDGTRRGRTVTATDPAEVACELRRFVNDVRGGVVGCQGTAGEIDQYRMERLAIRLNDALTRRHGVSP